MTNYRLVGDVELAFAAAPKKTGGPVSPNAAPMMAQVSVRKHMHQGAFGHLVSGKDTKGRKVSVFTPHGKADAAQVVANIKKGKHAFAHHMSKGK